ncbi:MAG: S41 family peptidase [Bacteroidales bacterium]|nr:S41 family peptidase [Bacteroidales bacterium]MBN2819298.1 S41 family peptidase [Bacteroidales bacterium]
MEPKQRLKVFLPLVVVISIITGMFIGRFYKSQDSSKYVIYPRTDKITNIINYVSKEYVDPIDKNEVVENTIPKILESLDPHSQYIPASDFEQVNETLEGNFSGIGVQFNMLNDTLIVIKAVANGPSEKVGIIAGDRIITVNDRDVAGVKMPSDSIVRLLKGPKGTQVQVGVQRKGIDDILLFDITRDNIPLYSVDVAYMVNSEIGYIRLNKFSRTTFEEFTEATAELLGTGMSKMILDLRGNGGGVLPAAVRIIDQFLDEGQLIVYTEGNARKREEFRASKGGLCQGIEVAILIDETSASASEIVAGGIQDNDRGLVIGRRSFGKGLVQEQNMLPDGSAIRLTIARYYTPTGRCIQKSYKNGLEDYYNELSDRYYHGEFLELDSINFSDSLKYTTPGGRTVYGGGGIMPDIFVPLDTSGVTDYLVDIRNRGLIYRFSLEYTDEDREKLSSFTSIDDLVSYLESKNLLKRMTSFASENGVKYNAEQYNISKEILETQLYAYIARNIFDNKGYFPIIEKIDHTLQVAIEELEKEEEAQ